MSMGGCGYECKIVKFSPCLDKCVSRRGMEIDCVCVATLGIYVQSQEDGEKERLSEAVCECLGA